MPEANTEIEQQPEVIQTVDQQIESIEALLNEDADAPLANQGNALDVDSGELAQLPQAALDDGGEPAQIRSTEQLAETEKVELSTEQANGVDYDQVIPMTDGREPMTVGQLKDTVTNLERERGQIVERENQVSAERRELDEVMQATGEIPPQLQELAATKRAALMKREHASMVEKIPEMQTREGFERVSQIVRNELLSNGVSEQEIGTITSSVVVKMVYDLARLKDQGKAAQDLGRKLRKTSVPGKAPGQKTKRSQLDTAVDSAMNTRNRDVKQDAIEQLING